MRYRAILVDKIDMFKDKYGTQTIPGIGQITGNDMLTLCEWAERILYGRKPPARVLIYETKEILVNTIFASAPQEPSSQIKSG